MLLALDVAALVRGTIGPRFKALPVLLVLLPLALILGTVQVTIGTPAMGFIIFPVAVVDVTVGVDQSSLTVGLVLSPVTLVHGAIGPDLDTFSLTNTRADEPLSSVTCSVLEHHGIAIFTLAETFLKLIIIVFESPKSLTHFLFNS